MAKIQRNLDAITPAQVIALRKIFVSLKDGMAKPEDFFDQNIVEAKATVNVTPKAKKPTLAEKAAAAAAKAKEPEPPAEPPVPETRTPPPDLPYTPEDEIEDIPDLPYTAEELEDIPDTL